MARPKSEHPAQVMSARVPYELAQLTRQEAAALGVRVSARIRDGLRAISGKGSSDFEKKATKELVKAAEKGTIAAVADVAGELLAMAPNKKAAAHIEKTAEHVADALSAAIAKTHKQDKAAKVAKPKKPPKPPKAKKEKPAKAASTRAAEQALAKQAVNVNKPFKDTKAGQAIVEAFAKATSKADVGRIEAELQERSNSPREQMFIDKTAKAAIRTAERALAKQAKALPKPDKAPRKRPAPKTTPTPKAALPRGKKKKLAEIKDRTAAAAVGLSRGAAEGLRRLQTRGWLMVSDTKALDNAHILTKDAEELRQHGLVELKKAYAYDKTRGHSESLQAHLVLPESLPWMRPSFWTKEAVQEAQDAAAILSDPERAQKHSAFKLQEVEIVHARARAFAEKFGAAAWQKLLPRTAKPSIVTMADTTRALDLFKKHALEGASTKEEKAAINKAAREQYKVIAAAAQQQAREFKASQGKNTAEVLTRANEQLEAGVPKHTVEKMVARELATTAAEARVLVDNLDAAQPKVKPADPHDVYIFTKGNQGGIATTAPVGSSLTTILSLAKQQTGLALERRGSKGPHEIQTDLGIYRRPGGGVFYNAKQELFPDIGFKTWEQMQADETPAGSIAEAIAKKEAEPKREKSKKARGFVAETIAQMEAGRAPNWQPPSYETPEERAVRDFVNTTPLSGVLDEWKARDLALIAMNSRGLDNPNLTKKERLGKANEHFELMKHLFTSTGGDEQARREREHMGKIHKAYWLAWQAFAAATPRKKGGN